MTRTIVALYDDLTTAQNAVQDLVGSGFSRNNISLVANDANNNYSRYVTTEPAEGHVGPAEGTAFGAAVGALTGALVTLGALVIPGIGPVIAAGPLFAGLAGAITGAVAGGATGGIVGGLLGIGVPAEEAHTYAEGIRRGGTLVSLTADDVDVPRAETILNRYNPVDVQRRAADWRKSGWNEFSDTGVPYMTDELDRERTAYDDTTPTSPTSGTSRTYDRNTRV